MLETTFSSTWLVVPLEYFTFSVCSSLRPTCLQALAMAKRALLVEDSSQQVSGVFPFGGQFFMFLVFYGILKHHMAFSMLFSALHYLSYRYIQFRI